MSKILFFLTLSLLIATLAQCEEKGKGSRDKKEIETEKKEKETEKESGEKEKGAKVEVDLEDHIVPKPKCRQRFSNTNCTFTQRQQGLAQYRAERLQLIQQLLSSANASVSASAGSNVSLPAQSASLASNASLNLALNSAQVDPLTAASPRQAGIAACNQATRLLDNIDRFARFNSNCQVRVFGRLRNPDLWIERCKEALGRD